MGRAAAADDERFSVLWIRGLWLVVVAAACLMAWSLCPAGSGETIAGLLQPDALWKVTWPMLPGAVVMLFIRQLPQRLRMLPEDNIVALARAARPFARRFLDRVGDLDAHLRRWPVAGGGRIALAPRLAEI